MAEEACVHTGLLNSQTISFILECTRGGALVIRTDKCPDCGSLNIGKGYWTGYSALIPVGKILSMGSKVIVRVCRDCGYLFDFRVEKPEKF